MSRAAYMREYRAKKKSAGPRSIITATIRPTEDEPIEFFGTSGEVIAQVSHEIQALREEVARLKRELAKRPERNPYTEFRPVPKPGKHQ